jgi:hypothetical protein
VGDWSPVEGHAQNRNGRSYEQSRKRKLVDCEGNAHIREAIIAATRVTQFFHPKSLAGAFPLAYISSTEIRA